MSVWHPPAVDLGGRIYIYKWFEWICSSAGSCIQSSFAMVTHALCAKLLAGSRKYGELPDMFIPDWDPTRILFD